MKNIWYIVYKEKKMYKNLYEFAEEMDRRDRKEEKRYEFKKNFLEPLYINKKTENTQEQ